MSLTKTINVLLSITCILLLSLSHASNNEKVTRPMVVQNATEKANANANWKVAFATGKEAQIVFMNVSTKTNPQNEIGFETHPFDQVIFITSGKGKAILGNNTTLVAAGDMIFIPKGTKHNVINLGKKNPLKLISVYSETDIPFDSVIKVKPKED